MSFFLLDHMSGNTPLDTLLALLQAEGAKIEEETEVTFFQLYHKTSNVSTLFEVVL